VEVGFGGKNHGAGTRTVIAAFGYGVMESAVGAESAGAALGDEVVGGTQNFEIVQVIEHGDSLALQLPEDGRRQVVVDAANVGEVGRKSARQLRMARRADGE
jgi:hypothetical protein